MGNHESIPDDLLGRLNKLYPFAQWEYNNSLYSIYTETPDNDYLQAINSIWKYLSVHEDNIYIDDVNNAMKDFDPDVEPIPVDPRKLLYVKQFLKTIGQELICGFGGISVVPLDSRRVFPSSLPHYEELIMYSQFPEVFEHFFDIFPEVFPAVDTINLRLCQHLNNIYRIPLAKWECGTHVITIECGDESSARDHLLRLNYMFGTGMFDFTLGSCIIVLQSTSLYLMFYKEEMKIRTKHINNILNDYASMYSVRNIITDYMFSIPLDI